MIELKGKYNTAKVFTEVAEQSALQQIEHLLDQAFVSGSKIRIMPDVHAGMGCTIGTTMTITDKVVPIVQPIPAWTSGIIRILLPSTKPWFIRCSIC